jgi:hypothetical protein
MYSKTLVILTIIAAATLVVAFAGCIDTEGPGVNATPGNAGANHNETTPASSPSPRSTCEISHILTPIAAWWNPQWSDDGQELDVQYTIGRNTLTERIHVGASHTPFGEPIQGSEVTTRKGEDIYGRAQNMTIGHFAGWHGTLKPELVIAYGTFICPAQVTYENGWFTRELNVTVAREFNEAGRLTSGSGAETFSGHLKTADGILTYSGTATATFSVKDGVLLWTDRVEQTTYSFEGMPYAEMVTVATPKSEYLGGDYVTVRENCPNYHEVCGWQQS